MAPPPTPTTTGGGLMPSLTWKQTIVAALLATLAASVVVTVFFVALGPARVHFSVASTGWISAGADGGLVLNLTLVANNTSHRAAVSYASIFVDVSNTTATGWEDNWVRADVEPPTPRLLPRGEVCSFHASVPLVAGGAEFANDFTRNRTSLFSVVVTAQARFLVGVAPTRLYDIEVSCAPVNFFHDADSAAAGLPPVKCI